MVVLPVVSRKRSVKVRKLVGFFRFWILHFWRHYLIRDIFGAILHLEMKKMAQDTFGGTSVEYHRVLVLELSRAWNLNLE
jgi:hypothetical protein